ncbi:DENN domain-containing protein 1A [Clonorchis sinensis]|uniref:DENN domain-containing protein 1A n=1 Tax=Clonorchis sinensis TaxID=79923 RepID=A0A8T1MF70_CLOSI|nr:DENN domain-containing protein 1A [Clonorchis sinensis]
MFSTRLKSSERVIDYLLIYDISDSSKGCQLEYCHPSDLPNIVSEAQNLKEFVFPCNHKNTLSEEYTLIFTDADGKLDFVSCVCLPTSGYIVCLRSRQPWFELFHTILSIINQRQLYSSGSRQMLEPLIDKLSIDDGRVVLPVYPGGPILSNIYIPIPGPRSHPFYHRYILEYYNTLSISNWIVVFESLLLEKSVIFYSNRFQRISSCVLASLSLLYPLTWVHLIYPLLPPTCVDLLGCPSPFVAGIHSCAVEKAKEVLNEGIRLVDLDNDVVYTSGSSEQRLPSALRQWLLRRCFSSHHAILRRKRPTQETAAASLVSPFLEAMAILLGGYREAMIRGTKTGSFTHVLLSSNWTFDPNTFMATRGRECQAYLRELLQSQMFHQFIESRLAELNSDLGMIHQDDFEDCISRVPSQVRSNLSDLLERGRRGFGRLATRLANVKLKRREQNKLSSESSSSESDFPKTPEPVALLKVPPTFRPASSPTRSVSQKTCSPAVSDAQLNIPRAQRSLLSSILDSVSDVSADWLRSDSTPTTTGAPHRPKLGPESQPVKSASKPVAVVEPTTPVSHVKIDIFPDTGRNHVMNLLDAFDPYRPERQALQPQPVNDDLPDFIRMLDPLNSSDQNGDLLK